MQKRHLRAAPSVVVLGGGTGLSTVLRGLKPLTPDISAIVAVTDDGGGSGVLRTELGMLPPGDIINCIQALSNAEPLIRDLLRYRYTDGSLRGQSFGNLFLAAINGISGSFDEAVSKISSVLSITGQVLPVTNSDVQLSAEFDNGAVVVGETSITSFKKANNCNIINIGLVPEFPPALPRCIAAINSADLIVFGPGSLYTSVLPNLLVNGVAQAVAASDAVKIYAANIMTQDGETEGYPLSRHISELFRYSGIKLFDYCLANDAELPGMLRRRYEAEGAEVLTVDAAEVERLGVKLTLKPLVQEHSVYARHDSDLLAQEILSLYIENSPTKLYGG